MSEQQTREQVITTGYQRDVAAWWDNRRRDRVNLALGEVDGLYHHHYGLGSYDPAVLEGSGAARDERIIAEMHRLETAQADLVLDELGAVGADDRLLDAGSGRGGTSIMAAERFGCEVDGVSISEYQVGFANERAAERGRSDRVRFHFRNMLDTGFPSAAFQGVWTNETTMYVDLFDLYREFARLLRPGGRYVCVTGCYNDVTGRSESVRRINEHYLCDIHPRGRYFEALAGNGLVPSKVIDLTPMTIPYWELREQSPSRRASRGRSSPPTARAASTTC
ncbi:geranyl diphosphate 2-C-methyltransferase [Actinomadura yumaensis]|uniref:geranyl diphosphate 2-C-methyltransferase n=1 Tax=Actinomadura yumaensis TaxID=111807 RepID=UPI003608CEE2